MKKINELYHIDKLLREFRAAEKNMQSRDYYNHETGCYEYIIDTLVPASFGRYQPGYLALITYTYTNILDKDLDEVTDAEKIIHSVSECDDIYEFCDSILSQMSEEVTNILRDAKIPGHAYFDWHDSGDIVLLYCLPAEGKECE